MTHPYLTRSTYTLYADEMNGWRFCLTIHRNHNNKWNVFQGSGLDLCPTIDLMHSKDSKGGTYDSFEEAEAAVKRFFEDFKSPPTRKQIKSYFNLKWIRSEHDFQHLLELREALLVKDKRKASECLDKLWSYTLEFIPDKILYYLRYHKK